MTDNELLLAMSDMLDNKLSNMLDNKLSDMLDNKLSDMLDNKLSDMLDNKLSDILDEKLEPINIRLEKLESDTSALRTGQKELRKDIKKLDDKVTDTYQLALDAWGTSTENRTWLEETM